VPDPPPETVYVFPDAAAKNVYEPVEANGYKPSAIVQTIVLPTIEFGALPDAKTKFAV